MARRLSAVAPDWWDYTTLDRGIIDAAARLKPRDLLRLSRPAFRVVFYDTLDEFYLAAALEYIEAWRQSTDDSPVGIAPDAPPALCSARTSTRSSSTRSGAFLGVDEWFDGRDRPQVDDASIELRAGRCELCFNRIPRALRCRRSSPLPAPIGAPPVVDVVRDHAGRAGRRQAPGSTIAARGRHDHSRRRRRAGSRATASPTSTC
jgi:hypothetical protein